MQRLCGGGEEERAGNLHRRDLVDEIAMAVQLATVSLLGAALGGAAFLRPRSASAETRWISGRPDPLRPTNIKEKPDGTKKDNRYLSCLNDCVPRCQGPPGSPAKERSDCLLECQQECCSTYEQCTYTIRG